MECIKPSDSALCKLGKKTDHLMFFSFLVRYTVRRIDFLIVSVLTKNTNVFCLFVCLFYQLKELNKEGIKGDFGYKKIFSRADFPEV